MHKVSSFNLQMDASLYVYLFENSKMVEREK